MSKSSKRILVVLAAGVAAIVAATAARAAEEKIALEDLPEAVRDSLNRAVGDGTIGDIEREDEDGQVVYEAEAIIDGKRVELEFSATGQLLETETDEDGDDEGESEETIALDQLPPAVQASLANAIPGVRVGEVTRESEGGHVYYEVEYQSGGAEHALELTANGDIVETESEVDPAALPPGVAAFLQSRYEGATIEEANFVTVQFYEIELKTARGDTREVQVLANGARIEVEDDDEDD